MDVILFIGIPGSGKSSFFKEHFASTHVRINGDMLGTKYREASLLQWCLDHEQSCVVDNTNTTREVRARAVAPALARGARVIGYFFQSKIDDCLARNRGRHGSARIPDVGVRDHHSRLQIPSLDEGFSTLHFVSIGEKGFTITPWHHEV